MKKRHKKKALFKSANLNKPKSNKLFIGNSIYVRHFRYGREVREDESM